MRRAEGDGGIDEKTADRGLWKERFLGVVRQLTEERQAPA